MVGRSFALLLVKLSCVDEDAHLCTIFVISSSITWSNIAASIFAYIDTVSVSYLDPHSTTWTVAQYYFEAFVYIFPRDKGVDY